MKYFSLTTRSRTRVYDTYIVALLRRMTNLEELKLCTRVVRDDSTYIDGIQLYDQFLSHMTQLTRFTFDIKTEVFNKNVLIDLPSNEDIQRSFQGRGYQQVASYVNVNHWKSYGKCHIYSMPYDFEYFHDLDNLYQGGMFHKVRQVTMMDGIRFEQRLFRCVSRDFPLLKYLSIKNPHGMKNKQYSSTPLIFPYLIFLDLDDAHIDYARLFLLKRNIHLPCLFNLRVEYESMKKITRNFTKDAIHFNFENLKSLDVCRLTWPRKLHRYFPLL